MLTYDLCSLTRENILPLNGNPFNKYLDKVSLPILNFFEH